MSAPLAKKYRLVSAEPTELDETLSPLTNDDNDQTADRRESEEEGKEQFLDNRQVLDLLRDNIRAKAMLGKAEELWRLSISKQLSVLKDGTVLYSAPPINGDFAASVLAQTLNYGTYGKPFRLAPRRTDAVESDYYSDTSQIPTVGEKTVGLEQVRHFGSQTKSESHQRTNRFSMAETDKQDQNEAPH